MNALDFAKISTTIDVKKADRVYNEILVPLIRKRAERNMRELSIEDDCYFLWVGDKLREIGYNEHTTLQWITKTEMVNYLQNKGFGVSYSCYSTNISW